MQVGPDLVTSANCKSQLQFQQTHNYQLLYITSSTCFQSAAVVGGRIANATPVQSPARQRLFFSAVRCRKVN
jgi:hypothetical protein